MKKTKNSQQPKKFKVLLIGDACIDIYRYGVVDRISPEAPVPIFKFTHEETRPGMVKNVQQNLENLGCEVTCLFGNSSEKTRLIDSRSNQHVLRLDHDVISHPLTIDRVDEYLTKDLDAVVISDYNKGFVSYTLVRDLRDSFEGPIFVDTKKDDLEYFEGCYVKVNAHEWSNATSVCTDLIITRGGEGAEYNKQLYPATPAQVVDVCGAGDTFLAALTYEYLNTDSMDQAITFANRASAITVQRNGVYAPTLEELK
jgi:D-beta-D-heptose 7-phosphate kinase/D-beta-D-heptose 1-phosphate adenosyltransferase